MNGEWLRVVNTVCMIALLVMSVCFMLAGDYEQATYCAVIGTFCAITAQH